jgi:hypothetical protein
LKKKIKKYIPKFLFKAKKKSENIFRNVLTRAKKKFGGGEKRYVGVGGREFFVIK